MKNTFFRGFLRVAGVVLVVLATGVVQAAGLKTLPARVPATIARLHLPPVASLAGTNQLHLAIGLSLRNKEALTNLLQHIYDPASPNYRHFLTPEQFAEMFGPSEQQYQDVIAFARAHGFTVTHTYSNRVVVDVVATAADIEKAFHVKMKVYQHPTENRTFYAPDTEPTVAANLPILAVQGMNNYIKPHPMSYKMPASKGNSASTPSAGTGPGGTYMGSDFRNAYAPGVSLTGSGQIVGLLQFDGYYPSDITTYENMAGLPNVPLENVLLDGFNGSPGVNNGEVCLDIEASIAMAPGLSKVVVFEGYLPDSILSSMAGRPEIKQFSASWGYSVSETTESLYQQLAAQGQTFFNASGDGDAWVGPIPYGSVEDPNITIVGGTTLTTSGTGGAYVSEKVWNWGFAGAYSWNPEGYAGSSGGISTDVPIPVWQQGISMTENHGSTTMRNLPDVALTADNVFVVYDNGSEGGFGGTSCASPLWAGFMALVNQQAVTVGKPPVGFLAPAVYAIAKGPDYANAFHDIVLGDNIWPGSSGNFPAVPGYDLCTGLGTPNGANFIAALVGKRTGILATTVNPPTGTALVRTNTQSIVVTVSDAFGVTNATVKAFITNSLGAQIAALTNFVNNGYGIYSNSFQVPFATNSLTMMVTATAPEELGATNLVSYFVVARPPNDNFVNATKVPVGGGSYLENNTFATIETNEPPHDGYRKAAGSLWWTWTPTTSTNVLINTIGSKVDNVLAVYTETVMTSNMPSVAATSSSLAFYKPAQISLQADAYVTYHIAVASVSSNALGTLGLQVTPGGQPDTNAPVVSFSQPLSGQTVSSSILPVLGTASDTGAYASGLEQVFVSVNGAQYATVGTTSWSSAVSLQPGPNNIKASAVDKAGNVSATATVQVNYLVPHPGNDYFVNDTNPLYVLTKASDTVLATNIAATKEVGEPNPAGNTGGKSLWWSFKPTSDGMLTLNTSNSTFDTILGLYTGTNVANLTTIADNDDAYSGAPGGFSLIQQAVRANKTYHILVDGNNGASGTIALAYSFSSAPLYHLTVNTSGGGTVQLQTTNSLGGVMVLPSASADFAAGTDVVLTALPDHNDQFDIWSGGVNSVNNPATVVMNGNLNVTANFVARVFTDGFESGGLSHLTWTTAGDAPWFVQTNVVDVGQYAARSGIITNSQSTSLILTTNFLGGTGSFDFKISSEQKWDTLSFYVDGNLLARWSGDIDWAGYSFPLTAGTHTLEWTYAKDDSVSVGLDAAFLDDVDLPIGYPPPQLQLEQQPGGGFVLNLVGQTNQQYVIQVSTDLVHWQNVSTNIASGSSSISIPLPANGTSQAQFYRAWRP